MKIEAIQEILKEIIEELKKNDKIPTAASLAIILAGDALINLNRIADSLESIDRAIRALKPTG